MKILRFIKQTFWLDVLVAIILLLMLSACDFTPYPTRRPDTQESGNASLLRGARP